MNDRIKRSIIVGAAVLIMFMIILWIIHSQLKRQQNLRTRSEQLKIAISIGEIRDDFIAMLPQGYDVHRVRDVFKRFTEAAERGNIAAEGLEELTDYFSVAVGDGDVSPEEADSIIGGLDNVIVKR